MASLPLYTQNEIYNLESGRVNWKKGETVQILPTFPYQNKTCESHNLQNMTDYTQIWLN